MIDGERLPTIDAKRVRLRWLAESDLDAIYAVFSDPQSMRWWSMPAMTERAEAVGYLERIREGFEGKTLFQWGVERKEDTLIIGTTTLFHLDAGNARAEIGYILASSAWGHGYATEAISTLLAYGFGEMKLNRVEADIDPLNAPSARALERQGFSREGLLRERWIVGGQK